MAEPTVIQATPPNSKNPYYTVLGEALLEQGWDFRYSTDLEQILAICRERADAGGVVVHVHQLEPFYRTENRGTSNLRLRQLMEAMAIARLHGAALVHTMHNEQPHDLLHLDRDAFAVRGAGGLASLVLVLGERLRRHGERIAEPGRVGVLRHPNFAGCYGPPLPKHEARDRLAVPQDATVFLSLGALKPYKGLELMLEGFRRAAIPGTRFMIAGGNPPSRGYLEGIEGRVAAFGPRRVRLVARPVPDDLMATWLSAADIAVFGFSRLFMSSSMMLALSYGLPVVVPDLGALDEYVTQGRNGFFFDADAPESMAFAMQQAVSALPIPRHEIIDSVAHLAPDRIAGDLGRLYHQALERRWEV